MPFTAPLFIASSKDWAEWDGTKDTTFSLSGADTQYAFSQITGNYGLIIYHVDNSSAGDDYMAVRLVTRTGDSISFGSQVIHNQSSVFDKLAGASSSGTLARTADGAVILGDRTGKFRTYYMSGSTLVQSDLIAPGSVYVTSGGSGIRRSDGNFIQYDDNEIIEYSVTDAKTSTPEMALVEEALFNSPAQSKAFIEQVPGFVDDDTAIFFQVRDTDANQFKAFKYAVNGADNTRGDFTGLGFDDYTSDSAGGTTMAEVDATFMTPPFETTGFSDIALQIEADSGGGKLVMHAYKNGETTYKTATVSATGIGDTFLGNGCWVGPTNNVFLYCGQSSDGDGTVTYKLYKYVYATNTFSIVATIDGGSSQANNPTLARFGNDNAILTFGPNHVRLLNV